MEIIGGACALVTCPNHNGEKFVDRWAVYKFGDWICENSRVKTTTTLRSSGGSRGVCYGYTEKSLYFFYGTSYHTGARIVPTGVDPGGFVGLDKHQKDPDAPGSAPILYGVYAVCVWTIVPLQCFLLATRFLRYLMLKHDVATFTAQYAVNTQYIAMWNKIWKLNP